MGNNSAQNTYSNWVEQGTLELGFADRELERLVDPACGHAAPNSVRRATPFMVFGSTVREALTPLLPPGERVGATSLKRCIPLFASVVHCAGRKPGHICVNIPVAGFFRVCAVGHTQLPTSSTIFQRFVKGLSPL